MDYFKDKEKNIAHAYEVIDYCEKNFNLETEHSLCNTTFFTANAHTYFECKPAPERVIFEQMTTVDAIMKYGDSSSNTSNGLCALNFASYRNPGGKFLTGSMAQEESLCHESNLYSILSNPIIRERFYNTHKKETLNDYLYNNDLFISNDVVFFRNNVNVRADIITCAAPNANAARRYKIVNDYRCKEAMFNRIDAVLNAAVVLNKRIIILGAFGCGVFRNSIDATAGSFRTEMQRYSGYFDKVIFAIPDNNTYSIFFNKFKK